MAAPLFIAAYSSNYAAIATVKTTTVTTQPGDLLVVYAASENGTSTIGTPTGNGVVLTLNQSVTLGTQWSNAYIWSGIDSVGGTNWTLTSNYGGTGVYWGMTCLVFRNSSGVGASTSGNVNAALPTLNLTSTQDNSAVVVLSADWNGLDGTSRAWLTVNSITPTNANGKEIDYTFVSTVYTVYGAYYNDVGAIGSNTFGLSAPTGQRYSMVALEVKGLAAVPNTAVTSWLRA